MVDRVVVYPGQIPLDTDLLTTQRNIMVALGFLAQATLGTATVVDGLACTQTTVASMTINVAPGSILFNSTVDATPFGSLNADSTDALVKVGSNLTTTQFTLTAPVSAGTSINYLLEASFGETDSVSVVLPYYNAANPAVPFSGPANSGAAQNTKRAQTVQLQIKSGTPATTGTQTTPAVDSGWVGLNVITVAFGAVTVVNGNISQFATAPIIPFKVPTLTPGFSRKQVFTSGGTFTWPVGVTQAKVTVIGGGAAGGSTTVTTNQGAAGGSAGGCSIKWITGVTPGTATTVTIGAGGTVGGVGAAGGNGGTSSFGAFCSATGGSGGAASTAATAQGNAGGAGSGGDINITGGSGGDGQTSSGAVGGMGGNSIFGGGGRGGTASNNVLMQGQTYGAGGGGAYVSGSISGGQGFPGVVIVEF